jgi:DNA polymerase-1
MASYVLEHLETDERKTGVIYGFLKQVLALGKRFETDNLYFCWDSKKSHRKRLFPEYKESRKKKELTIDEIENIKITREQLNQLRKEILPELGFNNSFIYTGYEADDIITTLSFKLSGHNIIVSTDNDLFQLLRDNVEIYNTKTRRAFTKKDFEERYEISPEDWAEVKALAGCSSDGVPGIPGVGEKKAIQYIKGTLSKGKIWERIESEEGQQIYDRNVKLVKLPFGKFDIDSSRFCGNEITQNVLVDVFDRLRFASFLNKKTLQDWTMTFCR